MKTYIGTLSWHDFGILQKKCHRATREEISRCVFRHLEGLNSPALSLKVFVLVKREGKVHHAIHIAIGASLLKHLISTDILPRRRIRSCFPCRRGQRIHAPHLGWGWTASPGRPSKQLPLPLPPRLWRLVAVTFAAPAALWHPCSSLLVARRLLLYSPTEPPSSWNTRSLRIEFQHKRIDCQILLARNQSGPVRPPAATQPDKANKNRGQQRRRGEEIVRYARTYKSKMVRQLISNETLHYRGWLWWWRRRRRRRPRPWPRRRRQRISPNR